MSSTASVPGSQQRADVRCWRHAMSPSRAGGSWLATMAAIVLASCGAQSQHAVTNGRPLPRFAVFAGRTGEGELPSDVAAALAHSRRTRFSNADIADARRV